MVRTMFVGLAAVFVVFVPDACSAQSAKAARLPVANHALDRNATEPIVVMLALTAVGANESETVESETVDPTGSIQDLQLSIIAEAVAETNVIVFVDDYESLQPARELLEGRADLQAAFAAGKIQIELTPHDSVWIRDYGPQYRVDSSDRLILIDPQYNDIRATLAARRERHVVNSFRSTIAQAYFASLIEKSQVTEFLKSENEDLRKLLLENSEEINQALADQDKQLQFCRDMLHACEQYDNVLANTDLYFRESDDVSPYEMMQLATGSAEVLVERPELFLDGGNVIPLSDGRLLSTSELFLRNRGHEKELTSSLCTLFGSGSVVYLEPLPGPVIKHVDMFAMPAVGKRILLSNFDPKHPAIRRSLRKRYLPPEVLALGEQAHRVMTRNKQRLQALGYEVIDVPSLYPGFFYEDDEAEDYSIFFPTLLNTLVIPTADGQFRILAPNYSEEEYEQALQQQAYRLMADAFDGKAVVVPLEATKAAQAQGAIHCLTATAPRRFSLSNLKPLARKAQ